jgi:pyruvate dehydrogenase E1 component alpha subunit
MNTFAPRSAPPLAVLRDDGSLDPANAPALSEELAIALYEHMALARALDVRVVGLQREGAVTQHASALGEEATIVGAVAAMKDQDWVFPSSREAAAAVWRGMPLSAYANHAFGTGRDAGKGRVAPDPPFWKAARVASVSQLVGTQISHAVGVAWAARIRSEDVASLVFFGEGATSSGDFHAGLNFAGVTRAPVVFVCRNNGWATSLPACRQTASEGFAVKAVAYGLRGMAVDGGDVVAVLAAVGEARRRAAAGEGGTLVEAIVGDAAGRGSEAADPIARMRRHLEGRGIWSAERERQLRVDVSADVDAAIAEAEGAPPPARATMFDDVFADVPRHLAEQRDA